MQSETGRPIQTVPDCSGSCMDRTGMMMTGVQEPDVGEMYILNPIGNSNNTRSKCSSDLSPSSTSPAFETVSREHSPLSGVWEYPSSEPEVSD